jgi:hypothetical protein
MRMIFVEVKRLITTINLVVFLNSHTENGKDAVVSRVDWDW